MSDPENKAIDDQTSYRIGARVTWVGLWSNLLLVFLKIFGGILGRSGALVTDGVHSASDLVSDAIVLVSLKISRRKADSGHPYGHGKFETFATMLVGMMLVLAGVIFFIDGMEKTWGAFHGRPLPRPEYLALIIALLSIIVKEIIYRYTRYWGERIKSAAVVANAWHHRSDALSSIATLVGIAGAMFMGSHFRVLDPIAAMLIAVYIIIVGLKIVRPAVSELLETSLPSATVESMMKVVLSSGGVLECNRFLSRRNGHRCIIDMSIKVNPHISVVEGHDIATRVEAALKRNFGRDMIVNIHVEPIDKHQYLSRYEMSKS